MKYQVVFLAMAGLALPIVSWAAPQPDAKSPRKQLSAEERAAARQAFIQRRGGLLVGQTEGKHYFFFDCTRDGLNNDTHRTFKQMETACNMVPVVEKIAMQGRPFDFGRKLRKSRQKDVGAFAVFYEGPAEDPIEVVYPMERFILVNVTPLRTKDRVIWNHRMNAMMWRALAFTAGGMSPTGFDCVMKNVTDVKGVDGLKAPVACPTIVQGIVNSSSRDFGFATIRRGFYDQACVEGWATPPTNDVQKAIWEKTHKAPTAPIVIKPEPAKGK